MDNSNSWKSCCGLQLNKYCIVYFTHVLFALGISSFCIAKLGPNNIQCEEQTLYTSILLFIFGSLINPLHPKSIEFKPVHDARNINADI